MRADLSVQSIATVLAALGTSAVLTACGGDAKPEANSPVNATEVTPTAAAPAEGQGSCGAHAGGGGCGAHAPADPSAPGTEAASAATPEAAPEPATAEAKPETKPEPAKKTPAAKKAPAAQAACGAGTCNSGPKKKLF